MKYIVSKQKAARLEKLMESRAKIGSEVVVFETIGETEDGKVIISMESLTAISETPWKVIGRKTATDETRTLGVAQIENGYKVPQSNMNCMSCGKKAGTLVVIRNAKTGEILQVGRECLKKYLGRDAELLGLIAEEEPLIENEWGISGFMPLSVSLATFLFEAKKDIAERGYIKYDPYANPRDQEQPTKQMAWYGTTDASIERASKNLPSETEEELAYLSKIREWADTKDAKSEFWQNVQNLLKGTKVQKRHSGFIACLPDIFRRDEERAIAKAKQDTFLQSSGGIHNDKFAPVGKGEKVDVEAIFEHEGGYDTQFGWTSIMTFRGKDGYAYVWKTASTPMWTIPNTDGTCEFFKVGDHVKLSGKVKDQSVYKDIHQTILTRCKLEMIEPKEKPWKQCLAEKRAKKESDKASDNAEKALDELFSDWNEGA